LRMNLIRGKEQTTGGHADYEWEHHLQSSSHQLLKRTIPRFRDFTNKSLHHSKQAAEELCSAVLEVECGPAFSAPPAAAPSRSGLSRSNGKWP
jgi:hypothetical protein